MSTYCNMCKSYACSCLPFTHPYGGAWPYINPQQQPKPHIRKLDSGSYGYFTGQLSAYPRFVANDIRSITLWVQEVAPLPDWMRRRPEVFD